jgi:glycosyltransferase involved in cell wall biosynthesis
MFARKPPYNPRRVVLITTIPLTLATFFARQIEKLVEQGFDVHAVSSPPLPWEVTDKKLAAEMHQVQMTRRITPVADLLALLRIVEVLRLLQPAIVQTHTPKAGFLGMLAALVTGVPIRIYTINGIPAMTQTGWRRRVVMATHRIACELATEVFCVSHSLRAYTVAENACSPAKITTLGNGGSHGVDIRKFDPASQSPLIRTQTRQRYGIPEDALVIGFVGRIVRDKGIVELGGAWRLLRQEFPNLFLLLCGFYERADSLPAFLTELFHSDPRVRFTGGFVLDMPPIYSAIDVCVLPTYREGLPNVALEAGSMEIPVIATRIPGCIDVVSDAITGLLVTPGNSDELCSAIRILLQSPEMRRRMGRAARELVSSRFSEERVTDLLIEQYRTLLSTHGLQDRSAKSANVVWG